MFKASRSDHEVGVNLNYQLYRLLTKAESTVCQANVPWLGARWPRGRSPWFDIKRHRNDNSPPLIFDVGGNVGQTVSEVSKWFPRATIHSFEPFEQTFQKLSETCRSQKRVTATPHQFACGESAGELVIARQESSDINSLRHQLSLDPSSLKSVERVRIIRLDEFAKSQSLDRLDILKTDTEGWDVKVLKGAGNLLSQVAYVYCEAGFHNQSEQSCFAEVSAYLFDFGFRFAGLYEVARGPRPATLVPFGNALFVRAEQSSRGNASFSENSR
tara:strand:+ start:14895 stop:15710 length:816 start_codon:yes stop_codon:yes gene_type:complete